MKGITIPDTDTRNINDDWEVKAHSTVYQAATDGVAVGYARLAGEKEIIGYTDENNPPTTIKAGDYKVDTGATDRVVCAVLHVKEGDFWELVPNVGGIDVAWLPKTVENIKP